MIERLRAIQFDKRAATGRTSPGFVLCENQDGEPAEVIAKLSAGCDRAETSLAMELVSAMLAGDLSLPIPQPYLIEMDAEWIESISDSSWRDLASTSESVAFGSKRVPTGFSQWIAGTAMVEALTLVAAGVLLFDSVIDNPDRRSENPNCLQRGDELRIIDHELCFGPLIIGWRPPWETGSLQHLATPGLHIFRDALRRRTIEWSSIIASWEGLSDANLADYERAIPPEWSGALPAVRGAIDKIGNARDHIRACVAEVQRVLTC